MTKIRHRCIECDKIRNMNEQIVCEELTDALNEAINNK